MLKHDSVLQPVATAGAHHQPHLRLSSSALIALSQLPFKLRDAQLEGLDLFPGACALCLQPLCMQSHPFSH